MGITDGSGKMDLSRCSTFDFVEPAKAIEDGADPYRDGGTYITQMAQVDMEMKKREDEDASNHNL